MKEIYENWKELKDSKIRENVVESLEVGTVLIEKETGKKALLVNKSLNTLCIWKTRTALKGTECSNWYQVDGREGVVSLFYKTDELVDVMAWKQAAINVNIMSLRAKNKIV